MTARVSGSKAVAWANPSQTFDVQLICFTVDSDAFFSIMQSSFHWIWVASTSSTLGDVGNIRYTPTSCFQTFPIPDCTAELEEIGNKYNALRQLIMSENGIGLTDIYNRLHDPEVLSPDIVELRNQHIKLDDAVRLSYGWNDLRLNYGFQSLRHGIRYAVSEETSKEILNRLIKLNRQRYQEEVDAGLHGKSATKTKTTSNQKNKSSTSQHSIQTSLFDMPVSSPESLISSPSSKTGNTWGSNASDQILAWLEAHKGWFDKSAILNGCGADPNEWLSAIDELLKDEYIESQGESDAIRYRAKP